VTSQLQRVHGKTRPGASKSWQLLVMIAVVLCAACSQGSDTPGNGVSLIGAWRSNVEFHSGALASIQGFEFMYVFNSGGTMTESSNYDAAPPVPPAYGIWKSLGKDEYEAKYEFFITRAPNTAEASTGAVGWLPGGRGLLMETIKVAADGNSFTSSIRYEMFDEAGKPAAGGGEGEAHAARMTFE
jgi:hypothetical protein